MFILLNFSRPYTFYTLHTMDDSTSTSDSTATTKPAYENNSHSGSYPFKNEVSLSINLDDSPPSTSNAPTPSPRHHTEITIPSNMEDVPLTPRNTDEPVLRNGIDNPGFEADKPRPLSSFGHNGQMNDSTLGRNKATNGKVADKPLVGMYIKKQFMQKYFTYQPVLIIK